jgi:hypothetical protein
VYYITFKTLKTCSLPISQKLKFMQTSEPYVRRGRMSLTRNCDMASLHVLGLGRWLVPVRLPPPQPHHLLIWWRRILIIHDCVSSWDQRGSKKRIGKVFFVRRLLKGQWHELVFYIFQLRLGYPARFSKLGKHLLHSGFHKWIHQDFISSLRHLYRVNISTKIRWQIILN